MHAKQGNMLLLIVLDACARLNSACWHFLSLTFPVRVPCCSWMLAVCSCVYLPLISTSPEECHFSVLSVLSPSVFLFVFTLLPLTLQSFLQAVAALPWNLLEMPEACIFFLQSDSDVAHLLNALFVCSPGLCWP